MTFIQKINPTNKEEEKKKFFFDPLYNPQFEYAEEVTPEELNKYGPVSFEYFDLAKSILDRVITKFGTESKYIQETEGEILSRETLVEKIEEYLELLGLEERVNYLFSNDFIARTSMAGDTIRIRLPIDHREKTLHCILDHEIGTHYLRTLNERNQVWFKQRDKFNLSDHLETEEGLAVLHYHLDAPDKHLWIQALYYYASCVASKHSFTQLYKSINKYIDNRERAWKICLRVKRGLSDTSKVGAFSKDQVYLRGFVKVVQWLKENQFRADRLYIGKISVEDLSVAEQVKTETPLLLPHFLQSTTEYRKKAEKVIKQNF